MDENTMHDAYDKWAAGRRARGAKVWPYVIYQRRVQQHAERAVQDLRDLRVKEAVAAGVIEAFTQLGEQDAAQPAAAPTPPPATRRTPFDAEYRHRYLGDPGVELPPSASAAQLHAAEQRTKRIEEVRARIRAAGGGLIAPPELMNELADALGVDQTSVPTALFMPVQAAAPVPYVPPGPERRSTQQIADDSHKATSRRRSAAEAELQYAEQVAQQSGTPLDARKLSDAAFGLYREKRGLVT